MMRIVTLLYFTFFLKAFAKNETNPSSIESWTANYQRLHERVSKISDQLARQFTPELMIIKNGHTIAAIPIDTFSAKVLKELDDVLMPYRQGLQQCVDKNHVEYRIAKNYSYESFSWFLDNYVRTLVKALDSQSEMEVFHGIKEKRVTTDRAIYAFTRLLSAYLEERRERHQNLDPKSYAADTLVLTSIQDIARRVFRLPLSQKFNREEALFSGIQSQPIFRDLASNEGGADLSLGLEPLSRLMQQGTTEPLCRIALPPREGQDPNG